MCSSQQLRLRLDCPHIEHPHVLPSGTARHALPQHDPPGLRWPRIYNRTFCPAMLMFGCVRLPGCSTSFLKQRRRRSHLRGARRRRQRLQVTPAEGLQGCWESVEGKGAAGAEGGEGVGVGVLGIEGSGSLLTPGRQQAQVNC